MPVESRARGAGKDDLGKTTGEYIPLWHFMFVERVSGGWNHEWRRRIV